MSNRIVEMFVFDIFIAILKIEDIIKDFDSADELLHSYRDWDSVIREYEIIGEATKYLLNENLIDMEYRKIVNFRNYITHGYFGIDSERVWSISKNGLLELKVIILEIMKNIPDNLKKELIEAFIEDNKYINFVVEELEKL
jgi:uncharacterized protein with HEPN domain